MRRTRTVALSLVWVLALAATARAQAPQVEVTAIPEYPAVRPGTTFRVAVRLRVPDGWHIYWTNPGGGGVASTMAWHLPAGVRGGSTEWPYPETDDAGADVSHVYRGTVVLFSSFSAEPGIVGTVRLSADQGWGLCRIVCVQQHHTVTLALPVARGAATRSATWAEAAAAMRLLPMRERGASVDAVSQGDSVQLRITGLRAGPVPGSWVTFFPLEPGRRSIVVRVRGIASGIAVTLPRAVLSGAPPGRLSGVLVAAHAPDASPPVRALAVDAPVSR
jgi:DsbC/DsbD-like thiol-disulfide interchange protein